MRLPTCLIRSPRCRPTHRRPRHGITLLEVLVSVFILTFGILGVAAMIPLGGRQIQMANIAERSSACGRAGLHQVKIRKMLDPEKWLQLTTQFNNGDKRWHNLPVWGADDRLINYRTAFVIDPLFIADGNNGGQPTAPPAEWFPYTDNPDEYHLQRITLNTFPMEDLATYWTGTSRHSFANTAGLRTVAMPRLVADRIFRWEDDITFDMPKDKALRPRRVQTWKLTTGGGTIASSVPTPAAPWEIQNLVTNEGMTPGSLPTEWPTGATPAMGTTKGDYSWMATVSPMFRQPEADLNGGVNKDPNEPIIRGKLNYRGALDQIYGYEVAIVVFFQRQFGNTGLLSSAGGNPTERMLPCQLIGGGWGGGDVKLTANTAGNLDMSKVKWLMLSGWDKTATDPKYRRQVWRWYRVLNTSDIENASGGGFERWVTLAGQDWRFSPASAATPAPVNCRAVLVDDVVGVYTSMIEVD